MRSNLPSSPSASAVSCCWCAASHSLWSLWRQRRFHVVQMYCHRLHFSPSTAGLGALEISQAKRKEKGRQLAMSEFPSECALKILGPSLSILANTEDSSVQLCFFLFLSNQDELYCLQDEITASAQANGAEWGCRLRKGIHRRLICTEKAAF